MDRRVILQEPFTERFDGRGLPSVPPRARGVFSAQHIAQKALCFGAGLIGGQNTMRSNGVAPGAASAAVLDQIGLLARWIDPHLDRVALQRCRCAACLIVLPREAAQDARELTKLITR